LELAGDGREYGLNLPSQGKQDGDGDHGNESENQGVLHEGLALLALHAAQRNFGAGNNFVNHCFSPPFDHKSLKFNRISAAVRHEGVISFHASGNNTTENAGEVKPRT
jgi:hypothetical protein